VRELTASAVERDPGAIDVAGGESPPHGTAAAVERLVTQALSGIHEALLAIAREVDELSSADPG
jgi:hypothetical protein